MAALQLSGGRLSTHEVAHGKRLGRGGGEYLGLARVDEDLVRVERLIAVVAPAEEAQVHCRLRRLGLHLFRVLSVAVKVDAHALLASEVVDEQAVAFGPQELANEVGTLTELVLRLRGVPAQSEELCSHAVHVARGRAWQLLQHQGARQ
jgi:hypothetical protein|tara:strand:- start:438 stop:884 length:447 start_codon:yes stop_codon:yes gene_type:complete